MVSTNCVPSMAMSTSIDDYENEPLVTPVMASQLTSIPAFHNILKNVRWSPNSVTVAGGNGEGDGLNQLRAPKGIHMGDNNTVYIADYYNHRVVTCKENEHEGVVIAGGNGQGNALNQLHRPTDVIFDKESNSMIICDWGNRRVVRWDLHKSTGEILVGHIDCFGIHMDDERYLYVSDDEKHEVRKYRIGDKNGILIAGGNGQGDRLTQFNYPTYIYIDREHSVYVSDKNNHRIMRWEKDAKEGVVVAGGNGQGNNFNQLNCPSGILVDELGTVYVADCSNHRVMRWCKGHIDADVIAGGNGHGNKANQFNSPEGLSFDRNRNLYVADHYNCRVQRFSIE